MVLPFCDEGDEGDAMMYYVIQIVAENGTVKYVCKGEYSYFSLTSSMQSAKRFNSMSEVEEAMATPDFTKRNVYSDKSSGPPSIIWAGLGICNSRKKSKGWFNIIKIQSEIVSTKQVEDELID